MTTPFPSTSGAESEGSIPLYFKKVEHAVILFEGDEPQAPFYDDCSEAMRVVAMAGGGMVVSKVYAESEWVPHGLHT